MFKRLDVMLIVWLMITACAMALIHRLFSPEASWTTTAIYVIYMGTWIGVTEWIYTRYKSRKEKKHE